MLGNKPFSDAQARLLFLKLVPFVFRTDARKVLGCLDNVPDDEIVSVNIPTGIPLEYELGTELRPLRHYYLGEPEEVARAVQQVASQGKAKAL